MSAGRSRRLSAKELMLSDCDAGKDFESLLDSEEIKPVHPTGNQPGIFIGRTDVETPKLAT